MTESLVTESLGIVANILSNVAFVPQIIKSYRCKHVEGISIMMFVTLFVTQICWIIYAIPIHAKELYISCTIEIFLLMPILYMYLRYSTPSARQSVRWFQLWRRWQNRRMANTGLLASNDSIFTSSSTTPQSY